MLKKVLFSLTLCSYFFCTLGYAQDCAPPRIVANEKSASMLTPEQEMVLGELVFQRTARDYRLVHDDKLSVYFNEIGERLTKHLPQTGLTYKFHLIDLPDVNAFNIPGGHVFITRKLAAFVKNEDELAGVMAHELGHAVVRHAAADFSDLLRKVLGVTALGDRKDIIEKYNLLIERSRTKRIPRREGHENEQQLEADRIGIFAMVAAGYDPVARSTYFDRLTESEGKTGSWLSELFGTTRPEQKRLREMIRATEQMAPACRDGRAAKATESFSKWQAEVISFREAGRKEELPGLAWKKELAPKLRSDVSHFAFSEDGKFLLVQDDFSVTLIEREALRSLFQIPVKNAREAYFSADGKHVMLPTKSMRHEKWSIAEMKPVEVRELAIGRDCWEHKFSPDGNYLACIDYSLDASLIDTKTGSKVWDKKDFYRLTRREYLSWRFSAATEGYDKARLFRIEYSPDSRFVIFSRSSKSRDEFVVNGAWGDTALALDLTTLKPANIGGALKKVSARPYLFLDSERILGMPTSNVEDTGIFSFPDGKRLRKFDFGAKEIKRTANPDYVIIKPLANAKMGVFDVKKGALAAGFNKNDGTFWNNLMAYESTSGNIMIREVVYNEAQKRFDGKDARTVEIPVSPIINLDAVEVSDNFNWLLMSSKTRGGLWNLETGERKFYVRGFEGGVVANDGSSVAEFPKLDDANHSLVLMNPRDNTLGAIRELPEKGAWQYGRLVLLRHALKGNEDKDGEKKPAAPPGDEESDDFDWSQGVRLELKDFVQDRVVWSRDFLKQVPSFFFDKLGGRLVFYWDLGTEEGKARLKESPELQAKAQALGNKADDYLVEIVDAVARKTVGTILLETGEGSFAVGVGLSAEDWLVLHDSRGRVLVYSIKDGNLRHRFFGSNVAMNAKRNQLAVENFPGEITLYNLDSGDREANLVVNGNAVFLRFNPEGDKLFVLSAAQSAYSFDLNKLSPRVPTQAK